MTEFTLNQADPTDAREKVGAGLRSEHYERENHRFRVEAYTVGKGGEHADPNKNEDVFRFNKQVIALADGATGKNDTLNRRIAQEFGGQTGGRIAAEIATREAVDSGLDGTELVGRICSTISQLCDMYPAVPMAEAMLATLAVARFDKDTNEIVVTQVGDTAIRVTAKDGEQQMFFPEKGIDGTDAQNRARAINDALSAGKDIDAAAAYGRESIMDSLTSQGQYRNNPHHKYGFGCIAAAGVPDEFVHVYRFAADQVETIELISDGYLYAPQDELPTETTTAAWEEHIKKVHAEDPHKYLKYLATKTIDDRSVMVAHIQ
jgi:hypothetical protein